MSSWERIDDVLTPDGIAKLKVGHVLTFDYEGSKVHLKIMRITPTNHVWARRLHLVSGDEMMEHANHEVDATEDTIRERGGVWCETCDKLITT